MKTKERKNDWTKDTKKRKTGGIGLPITGLS